ncbi:head-tail adaptor protein [Neomegalonema sp.]|uniref:phage head completion protein n=1 Tax=Neomegalonema sp. TaxID=2039713 RepID=UPI00262985E6|nr:head-tail adaptor protein [Neomegalonema sp.]MDD2870327.1 head-tail adaptor protein [Neomegalonema sp.]
MSAGLRNRRIAFEQWGEAAETPPTDPLLAPGGDPLGPSRGWVRRFERWAHLRPETLREASQGGGLVATGFWRCEVLCDPETEAVTPEGWRVCMGAGGGRVFNIRSAADPDGCRRSIVMRLEQGVAT